MADSERILAEEIEHAQTAEEVEAALTELAPHGDGIIGCRELRKKRKEYMADYHKHLHQLYPLSKPPWKREAVEVETSDPHDCGDPACKGYREWQKYKMADELFRASALALGFTINFRQTVKDWQRFPEVAVLFSKITDIVTRYRAVVQGGPSHE